MSKLKSIEWSIPGHYVGTKVTGPKVEDISKALKRFRLLYKQSQKTEQLRERQQHTTEGQKRREVVKNARYGQKVRDQIDKQNF